MQFQFSGSPQRRRLGWACVLCLPRPEQLRPPGGGRARSPRCGAPSPLRSPSLSFCACGRRSGAPCVCSEELVSSRDPPGGCQPSRISGSLWLEPVCSLVGDVVSGAEFAPFPSPLPPASGREWACPQPASSSLELLSPSFVL